jgi:hypothetical protein
MKGAEERGKYGDDVDDVEWFLFFTTYHGPLPVPPLAERFWSATSAPRYYRRHHREEVR